MKPLHPTADDGFGEAVVAGLSRRPRRIPCKYLYDHAGSLLFERITDLPTYYLTRTEIALLERHAVEIARHMGPGCRLVEFGAGAMRKTRPVLAALERPAAYLPIDVAAGPLAAWSQALAAEHPGLPILPLVADFTGPLTLPPAEGRVLGFFPGSTIGNMAPREACAFLKRAARLVGPDGALLIGVDLVKDPARLQAAYDDPEGVTAAFIRNLLVRANRELGADFVPHAFDHRAWWNGREGRIEIHLVSRQRQRVTIGGRAFHFRNGDTVHAEDCYKFTVEQFHWLARVGGFVPAATWIDDQGLFSLHLLTPSNHGASIVR